MISRLTEPYARRLGVTIKRYERWTSIEGKKDLMEAGLNEEEAEKAMQDFRDQIDDPNDIDNYDVE